MMSEMVIDFIIIVYKFFPLTQKFFTIGYPVRNFSPAVLS